MLCRATLLLMSVLLAPAAPRLPAFKPHPSVFRMANEARLVVEGTVGDGGAVTITRRWFAAEGVEVGEVVMVPALAELSRTPFALAGPSRAPLRPDAVLLFLGERSAAGECTPLYVLDGGARGVLWFEGGGAWGYTQQINPGPYALDRWHVRVGGETVAATPDDVRAQLKAGLAARVQWAAALAIEDAGRRAAVVAGWLGTRSPDGEFWLERMWPDVSEAVKALGDAAVAPLAVLVAVESDADAVHFAARMLADRGTAARAATPSLIARLRDPRGAHALPLVEALTQLADPRATAVLRDQLAGNDEFVAAQAARALQAAGDGEVVPRLIARIPADVAAANSPRHLTALLEALHELDAAAAERIARERFLQHPEVLQEREWMRQLLRH